MRFVARLIITAIVIIFLLFSDAFAGAGMGHAFEALAWFLILTIFVPGVFLIIWLFTRIWPKKHTPTSWFIISSFDTAFIIYNSFALSAWSSGFGTSMGFGGALSVIVNALFGKQDIIWLTGWKIALLVLVILFTIFGINRILYGLTRPSRIVSHFMFSLISIVVILGLHEPSISGPFVRWFVKPSSLFLDARDPEIARGVRWSDYYGFDSELIDYYHFEDELLGHYRYDSSEFDFYEHYTKRTIIDTNTSNGSFEAAKYLLLHDLGNYQLVTQEQRNSLISKAVYTTPGYYVNTNPGLLHDAHFALDHTDTSYSAIYRDRPDKVAVRVEVTQHAGGDSDRWLQHELESVLKGRAEDVRLLDKRILKIDTEIKNNIVLSAFQGGFWSHTIFGWTHGNTVITVNWSRPNQTVERPYNIIAAYLAKFPSDIKMTSDDIISINKTRNAWNRDVEYIIQECDNTWNRKEMQRQLWLSNKWLTQLQNNATDYDASLRNTLRHTTTFLKYKEAIYNSDVLDEKKNTWNMFKTKDSEQLKNLLNRYNIWIASEVKGS